MNKSLDSLISQALLKATGDIMKEELMAIEPNEMKIGDIIHTSGGNSKFTLIFHVRCPYWNKKNSEVEIFSQISKIAYDLIAMCDQLKLESILLPPISSGNCGVPKQFCAKALFDGFNNYLTKNISNVKKISICIKD
jgi:O-acetyl-ADP-ribose deacetylase (regulator of RNase III)